MLLFFFENKLDFSTTENIVIGCCGAEQLRGAPENVHFNNCCIHVRLKIHFS